MLAWRIQSTAICIDDGSCSCDIICISATWQFFSTSSIKSAVSIVLNLETSPVACLGAGIFWTSVPVGRLLTGTTSGAFSLSKLILMSDVGDMLYLHVTNIIYFIYLNFTFSSASSCRTNRWTRNSFPFSSSSTFSSSFINDFGGHLALHCGHFGVIDRTLDKQSWWCTCPHLETRKSSVSIMWKLQMEQIMFMLNGRKFCAGVKWYTLYSIYLRLRRRTECEQQNLCIGMHTNSASVEIW